MTIDLIKRTNELVVCIFSSKINMFLFSPSLKKIFTGRSHKAVASRLALPCRGHAETAKIHITSGEEEAENRDPFDYIRHSMGANLRRHETTKAIVH